MDGRLDQFSVCAAGAMDPDVLADLRVVAMQPSLTAVGRFDPERARARFLEAYVPECTRVIRQGQALVGFYVVLERADHLYLDHLYVHPDFQGAGVGAAVVTQIQNDARARNRPVHLMALKQSASNAFYKRCGFKHVSSDEYDNHYVWTPD